MSKISALAVWCLSKNDAICRNIVSNNLGLEFRVGMKNRLTTNQKVEWENG